MNGTSLLTCHCGATLPVIATLFNCQMHSIIHLATNIDHRKQSRDYRFTYSVNRQVHKIMQLGFRIMHDIDAGSCDITGLNIAPWGGYLCKPSWVDRSILMFIDA